MKKASKRIGIDISPLANPITGIGRYLSEILIRLLAEDIEWYLYSSKPIIFKIPEQQNVHLISANIRVKGGQLIWAQTILPYWVKRDCIDLFWSPTHRLPLLFDKDLLKVVTIHDLVWRRFPQTMRPLNRFLDSFFMERAVNDAHKIIAVSNSTARDLIEELHVAIEKISIINLAPFLNLDVPLDKLLIKGKFILFVGTIEPRKNLARIIEAFSSLDSSVKNNYFLVISGKKGWGNIDIDQLCRSFGVEDRVRYLGYLADYELNYLYKNAFFLVMPSLYEGFGLPLIEAMQFGTPAITSNLSSMPEVVGGAGILVDPSSTSSIADGMKELFSDHDLRQNLSEKCLMRIKEFNWDLAAKETFEIFNGLLFPQGN